MAGFNKLMRYCDTVAEYEAAKANGTVTDDTLVIVVQDKVAKFKGETFDWSGGGGADTSMLATKEEVIDNEEVTAVALHEHERRIAGIENELLADVATKEALTTLRVELEQHILENEEVVAAAFNDLHKQIKQNLL